MSLCLDELSLPVPAQLTAWLTLDLVRCQYQHYVCHPPGTDLADEPDLLLAPGHHRDGGQLQGEARPEEDPHLQVPRPAPAS